ncbi:MAG: hypothetical protein Kow0010_11690 [Dehalococcoidia bacterium]
MLAKRFEHAPGVVRVTGPECGEVTGHEQASRGHAATLAFAATSRKRRCPSCPGSAFGAK